MKKRFIISPAITLFSFLISITSHSQEIFEQYLSRDSFNARLESLRAAFGKNKTIPTEIEIECLAALSHCPVTAFTSKSQQLKGIEYTFSSKDYLKKSKKQRTTGFILLGSGAAIFTGGAIAMQHSQSKGGNELPFVLGGLAMSVTSIPFFIASFGSKHKANLYMNNEVLMVTPNINSNIVYNSVGFKIDF